MEKIRKGKGEGKRGGGGLMGELAVMVQGGIDAPACK